MNKWFKRDGEMMDNIPDWAIRSKADRVATEQGCYWDSEKAQSIVDFAERHFRPQFISGPFKLLEWQRRFLMSLYGWRLPNGNRRFRFANLHISKKNGKTLLVSIICAFELVASGQPSPFVVSASASKENAAQVYSELSHTLYGTATAPGPFRDWVHCVKNQKKISVAELNAEYRSLASDGDRNHGYNCSVIVLDECHAHKSAELYNALRYAHDARPDGLCVLISTAGDDTSHWYYSVYQKSKRVLAGDDTDITHYAEIYETDDGSDPEDVSQWYKACPSLGTSFSEDQFRRELLSAKTNTGDWLNFQRLKLNKWVRPDEAAWLDVSNWDNFESDISESELKKYPCFLGVDLSQTTDPSSISAVWMLPNRKYFIRSWATVCHEGVKLREKTNLPRYQQYQAEGSLHITTGDRIDDRWVFNKLVELVTTYTVRAVNFDPNGAIILAGQIESYGVKTGTFPQTYKWYNGVMRYFETCYTEKRILHGPSGWLRYCFTNVRLEISRTNNEIRPFRKISSDHIDGAISTLLAFISAAAEESRPTPVIPESWTPLVI